MSVKMLFTLLCLSIGSAQASDLAASVNQRLSYMKDVAAFKAEKHRPIEDLQQEQKVLAASKQRATQFCLDENSVVPFIQAQMDAAKAVQYRFRADWLATPIHGWQPRPLEEVRGQLAKLNDVILQQIAQGLQQKTLNALTEKQFVQLLTQPNLSAADKSRLYRTLQEVRLWPGDCHAASKTRPDRG